MNNTEILDHLEHHGVKGMKWGVRGKRSRVKSGKTIYKKTPDRLSDVELRKRISRLEMEKKYSELNNSSSKSTVEKIQKGHDHVKQIIAVGTTVNALIALSRSPAAKSLLKKRG